MFLDCWIKPAYPHPLRRLIGLSGSPYSARNQFCSDTSSQFSEKVFVDFVLGEGSLNPH